MSRVRAPELEPEQAEDTEYEDVDDLVGIATELMQRDENKLDREMLHEVGRELDIPPEYLEEARTELAKRRALAKAESAAKTALRKKITLAVGAGVLLLTAAFGVGYTSTASTLRERHAELSAREAQVQNVRERQAAVIERLGDRAPTPDIDAELIGAENRVRVETQRYAESAALYNEAAGGSWASFVAGLAGVPTSVPLSP